MLPHRPRSPVDTRCPVDDSVFTALDGKTHYVFRPSTPHIYPDDSDYAAEESPNTFPHQPDDVIVIPDVHVDEYYVDTDFDEEMCPHESEDPPNVAPSADLVPDLDREIKKRNRSDLLSIPLTLSKTVPRLPFTLTITGESLMKPAEKIRPNTQVCDNDSGSKTRKAVRCRANTPTALFTNSDSGRRTPKMTRRNPQQSSRTRKAIRRRADTPTILFADSDSGLQTSIKTRSSTQMGGYSDRENRKALRRRADTPTILFADSDSGLRTPKMTRRNTQQSSRTPKAMRRRADTPTALFTDSDSGRRTPEMTRRDTQQSSRTPKAMRRRVDTPTALFTDSDSGRRTPKMTRRNPQQSSRTRKAIRRRADTPTILFADSDSGLRTSIKTRSSTQMGGYSGRENRKALRRRTDTPTILFADIDSGRKTPKNLRYQPNTLVKKRENRESSRKSFYDEVEELLDLAEWTPFRLTRAKSLCMFIEASIDGRKTPQLRTGRKTPGILESPKTPTPRLSKFKKDAPKTPVRTKSVGPESSKRKSDTSDSSNMSSRRHRVEYSSPARADEVITSSEVSVQTDPIQPSMPHERISELEQELQMQIQRNRTKEIVLDKLRLSLDQMRHDHENETAALMARHLAQISEVKKKLWCNNCGSEAEYHCCLHSAYCSVNCQVAHWQSGHKRECWRVRQDSAPKGEY